MRFLIHCRACLKMLSFAFCLGFLAVMLQPSVTRAQYVNSNGMATITSLNFSLAFDDPAQAYLTGLSGGQLGLNGVQTDFGVSDYTDGYWGLTSWSDSLGGGSVSGSASTFGTGFVASSTLGINLAAPGNAWVGPGVPSNAAATLWSVGFTPGITGAHLLVTADYSLDASAQSFDALGSVFSDVSAGLFLYGYDEYGNPLDDPLISAMDRLVASIIGVGYTGQLHKGGTLTLEYDLLANNFYDFEASVVANGAAPVPEPATLLLVGSGLAGLGALRRSRKKA